MELPAMQDIGAPPVDHSTTATTIESLPHEIFDLIFQHAAGPILSLSDAVCEEPSFSITSAESTTLKDASLVSRVWRRYMLPLLFKHTRLILRDSHLCSFNLKGNVDSLLSFLKAHDLVVSSFILGVYNHEAPVQRVLGYQSEEYQSVWTDLFQAINPRVVTIVAPPRLLGDLTRCVIDMEDADSFNIKYQILQLSVEKLAPSKQIDQSPRENDATPVSQPQGLLQISPWTSVLLNEGSHMEASLNYDTPRHHRAPSLLNSLLIGPLYPATATTLTYVAIFPLRTHFETLTYHLPAVHRLSLHLSPKSKSTALFPDGPKDGFYQDEYAENILQERLECYTHLAKYLLWDGSDAEVDPGNWPSVKEFEPADLVKQERWEESVGYMLGADVGWRVGRKGLLVRD
ncbi:hypothetical protein VE02_08779 [Pseudogymnoascus sp. 03VT05]|nr:hypothetical protein VE02_08779 [Pseudogymnoascus sp. 03VT05]